MKNALRLYFFSREIQFFDYLVNCENFKDNNPLCNYSSSTPSSENFSTMCKNLRLLNAIKEYKIGMPLTMSQFDFLSAKVVIDRLLQRRLFALASKMCQFMQIQGN